MPQTINQGGYSLPPNPTYLEFKASEGKVSRWPESTTRVVDHEGCVNYFELLGPEHGQHIRWRVLVGEAVARTLKLPGGFSVTFSSSMPLQN